MQQLTKEEVTALVNEVMAKMGKSDSASTKVVSAENDANNTTRVYDGPLNEVLGEGGCEPFDFEYGLMSFASPETQSPSPYERINRIIHRVHQIPETVDDERAMLYTEAHKKFGGAGGSQIIKNAKILAHILQNVTINIYPDELIVGEMGAPARFAPIFPEFSYDWIEDEIKNKPWSQRSNDIFQLSETAKDNLLGIADYWRGKNLKDQLLNKLTWEEIKGSSAGGRPVFFPNLFMYGGVGHTTADYKTLLQLGFGGIKKKVIEYLGKIEDVTTREGIEKREFYTASLISLEAASDFFRRYAELAKQKAREQTDSNEKKILEKIASNLEWTSENPPRDFWEAMQLYHLATNIILIESNGHSISYGRFDQLLYPFYEKDMKEGKITKSFAAQIIESFYIKLFELRKLRDEETAILNSEVGMGGTCLVVGGVDVNGRDATNDLTYLALEAHAHTRMPDPWFAIRWHHHAPWEFKVKVVETIKIGTGQPKCFNDQGIIPAMLGTGHTVQDARDYSLVGCVELDSPGKEYGAHDSAYFSLPMVFELAINHGYQIVDDPKDWDCNGGKIERLGLDVGGLEDMHSVEDVMRAYEKEMKYWVDRMATFINATELAHAELKPLPYLSSIKAGTIENGKDVTAGGQIYNLTGPQGVGPGTVADCMTTIRQLIFEEKKITATQLLDALRKNWVGYEDLHQLVNSSYVHHYGNDDDYADQYAVWASNVYFSEVESHVNTRGGRMVPGLYSVSANVGIGMVQGASADGRKAHEAVSNCIGPDHTSVACHDVNGPTAMANSAAKIDHQRGANGTLLNVRFTPHCVAGKAGTNNMIDYMDAYFDKKTQHVQYNIMNNEVLKDAQKHPENYQGLLVRVAGYSAYFVRLSKALQDDLIGRNSYDSF